MEISKIIQKIPLLKLILIEIFLGLLGSLLSFYLFASLTEDVLGKDTLHYDQIISNFIYSLRTPSLTQIMKVTTFIGNVPIVLGITVIIVSLLIYKRQKIETALFALTIIAGGAFNFILKILFHRPRPQLSPLLTEKDFSYPSGHSMNNLIFYGFLIFLFFRFTRRKKFSILVGIIGSILIGLIGFSRIYLGVHYPSDIIGGYLAGSWILLMTLLVDKTITLRQGIKEH